jgi:cytochrome P450
MFKINSHLSTTGAGGRNFLSSFAREKITNHKQQHQNDVTEKKEAQLQRDDDTIISISDDGITSREPFMTKMIRSQRQNPEKVSDYHLVMLARSNLGAGFDTTAISLSSVVYHLIKTPRAVQKLRDEFAGARKAGELSERVTFHESQDLPYFQAVMKEALRMHSATGLPLWRVVPEGGVELDGVHFPEGTVLGINSWVSHYDKDVFTNPTEFCPERWIDQDEAKLKVMNDMYIPVSSDCCERVGLLFDLLTKVADSLDSAHELALADIFRHWKCRS